MSYFWFELFFAIFLGILAYYAYFKLYISKYWKNHNVFHAEPIFIVGFRSFSKSWAITKHR
ncbi:hypothetical protein Phum_PHUM618370 [Pediculus humanus corporis]|uniref:Cytochrome P450 n=1 Tax=Pediculus humanus subsp. corporis TaxID=121224 RepID=E0W4F8_PEDHC|nr:uncharacterized protein Phum_PHUM618370 [Pediculus humanus corporis]EEB20514.1 hypothetical protein Phum_PHUM618370 [Pediculus humanus corporis]